MRHPATLKTMPIPANYYYYYYYYLPEVLEEDLVVLPELLILAFVTVICAILE